MASFSGYQMSYIETSAPTNIYPNTSTSNTLWTIKFNANVSNYGTWFNQFVAFLAGHTKSSGSVITWSNKAWVELSWSNSQIICNSIIPGSYIIKSFTNYVDFQPSKARLFYMNNDSAPSATKKIVGTFSSTSRTGNLIRYGQHLFSVIYEHNGSYESCLFEYDEPSSLNMSANITVEPPVEVTGSGGTYHFYYI